MTWATTKARRLGYARAMAAGVIASNIVLVAWATIAGPAIHSAQGVVDLYVRHDQAVATLLLTTAVLGVVTFVLAAFGWQRLVEHTRVRDAFMSPRVPGDWLAGLLAFVLPMAMIRLGIGPAFTVATLPDEALGSFVINPASAASIFVFWMSTWACLRIIGLFVVTLHADGRTAEPEAAPV